MSKHRPKAKSPPIPKDVTIPNDEELDRIEADPRFNEFMDEVDEAEREGRTISHEEVLERMHAGRPERR
jgi:hypothetical protein